MKNIEKYKDDFARLKKLGSKMYLNLLYRVEEQKGTLKEEDKKEAKEIERAFESNYQSWYTESYSVIKQLLPDRLSEFVELYKGDGKRKKIESDTYHIQDWLNGIRSSTNIRTGKQYFDSFGIVAMRFFTQVNILESLERRFESTLFDIKQLVQADLFDSELDSARELTKKKFLRGAGAIAGVVLEKHLAQVASNHKITTQKKHPTISDFNELLKNGGVLDVPNWRQIQRLGDIRNLCDHNKDRDPTKEEVEELIDGVDKFTKTLF